MNNFLEICCNLLEAIRVVLKALLGLVIYLTNTVNTSGWYCEAGFRVIFGQKNPNLHDPILSYCMIHIVYMM